MSLLYAVFGILLMQQAFGQTNSRQCNTIEDKPCVFPFKFKDKTFFGCTIFSDPDDRFWCSTKVDEDGNHVVGQDEYGYCSDECFDKNNSNRRTPSTRKGSSKPKSGGLTPTTTPSLQDELCTAKNG